MVAQGRGRGAVLVGGAGGAGRKASGATAKVEGWSMNSAGEEGKKRDQ